MKGLWRRALTGIIFVAVMVSGIYGGPYSFVLLFALITGLSLWEFYNLVLSRGRRIDKVRRLLALAMGMTPYLLTTVLQLNLVQNKEVFIVFSSLLFFPLIFSAFIHELYSKSEAPFQNLAFIVLGVAYVGVPFALLQFIAFEQGQYVPNVVFGLLLLNWANDSFAYMVGSRIGKTPLFPSISPKKTWEGASGGALGTMLAAIALFQLLGVLRLADWLALGVIVVLFGSLGDLVESMLKRSFRIKDSGSLLPGHGGILDRFDAFLFMLPFATAYLLWASMSSA